MARFLKYQFDSEEQFETVKASASITSSVNGLEHTYLPGATVTKLYYLTETPAVLSEDGRTTVTPAVLSDKFSVDILWETDEAAEFEQYRIYCDPASMAHTFLGLESLYELEYNNQAQ